MRIGVIGAGNVGSTLGRGLASAGHSIQYGVRDPRAEVPERLWHDGALVGSVRDTVAWSEVLILATPWGATESALAEAGDLGGRPLLDATNPLGARLSLTHGHTDSGGEQVQRWAPTARVVKVFHTTGAENMADPIYGDQRAILFACGDDADAVAVAVRLSTDLGFETVPLGPLTNARLTEPFARLWIELALVRGAGRGVAFSLLRR